MKQSYDGFRSFMNIQSGLVSEKALQKYFDFQNYRVKFINSMLDIHPKNLMALTRPTWNNFW